MSTNKETTTHNLSSEKETTTSSTVPPDYGSSGSDHHVAADGKEAHGAAILDRVYEGYEGAERSDNFWTRNGLNLESFKMRSYGVGIVELDRSMKKRHLHMIAIGGSIGAGFFVGSGGAFVNGVSTSVRVLFIVC